MNKSNTMTSLRNIYTNFQPTAYLFPTMKCNLNCCMCYSGSAMHRPVKYELSHEDYLMLVDSLIDQGFTRFDISGGEPLLRNNLIFKIAEKIKKRGAKLQMVTNGTFLVKTLEKYQFKTDDFDFIAVSLDSPDEATHNKIRGYEKAYSSAIEGIQTLVSKGFNVGLNAVCMPENSGQFGDLLKLAESLGVSFVHLLRNRYISPLLTSTDTFTDLNWNSIYEQLEASLDSAPDNLLVIATLPQYIHQEFNNQVRAHFRYKENILIRTDCIRGCGAFNRNIVITSEGNVTGCVAMINEPKFWIGNINKTYISKLLDEFPDWIEKFNHRSKNLYNNSVCGHCSSFIFCKGGCPMVAEKFYIDWNKNDPSCTKVYNEIDNM